MEKLLLGCFFPALEEMDIVDEEQVGFAITPAELRTRTVQNGTDQLVHELLCPDVGYSGIGTAHQRLVGDGLH